MNLRYDEAETPHQLKDEDRWFKYFSKKQLIIVLPTVLIIIFVMYAAIKFDHPVSGVVFSALIALVIIGPIMFPMPQDMYLFGGGRPIFKFILCKIISGVKRSKRI